MTEFFKNFKKRFRKFHLPRLPARKQHQHHSKLKTGISNTMEHNPPPPFACSCGKDYCVLDNIPKVDIDPDGVFKYILIKVTDKHKENVELFTTIVRGYMRHNYHTDIFHEVRDQLKPLGLELEVLGGGKIAHQADLKKLHVYGFSQGYGQAEHQITAKLLREAYPSYTVTVNDN